MENQATDRAFRIGQTRNVQVHKFVCVGTLEEKIDEMIERKKERGRAHRRHRRGLADRTVDRRAQGPVRAARGGGGRVGSETEQERDEPWDYWDYSSRQPAREAKGGIKAQSSAAAFGESWWAKRWIEVLESFDIGAA